jgi:hypothetical protein
VKHSNLRKTPNKNTKIVSTNKFYTVSVTSRFDLTTTPQLLYRSGDIAIKADKKFSLYIYIPANSPDLSWGSMIIATNLIVNGTTYSLGNSGLATNVTVRNRATQGTYNNTKIIDLIADRIIPVGTAYKIKLEIYGSTKADTAILNSGMGINENILTGRGTLLTWASDQNFMTGILQELPR